MNALKFERLVISRLDSCRCVLLKKNEEYASETDRLHNFKVAGRARGVADTTALDGMLMKHLVSVWDAIDKMEEDREWVPTEAWIEEKVGDVINYMLLFEGCIEDRKSAVYQFKEEEK